MVQSNINVLFQGSDGILGVCIKIHYIIYNAKCFLPRRLDFSLLVDVYLSVREAHLETVFIVDDGDLSAAVLSEEVRVNPRREQDTVEG